MRRIAATAVTAFAALFLASAASAAVWQERFYQFDTSEAFSGLGAGMGTVTAVSNGVDTYISVYLDEIFTSPTDPGTATTGWEFRDASDRSHHDLTFDLHQANSTNQLNNLVINDLSPRFLQDAGSSFTNSPFAGFNYAIDCKVGACTKGWKAPQLITAPPNPQTMHFKLAGISLDQLASVPYTPKTGGGKQIFFAVDVQKFGGSTGAIGASWNGFTYNFNYAPEPETWALLMLGFGCIGADLRRRRKAALAA